MKRGRKKLSPNNEDDNNSKKQAKKDTKEALPPPPPVEKQNQKPNTVNPLSTSEIHQRLLQHLPHLFLTLYPAEREVHLTLLPRPDTSPHWMERGERGAVSVTSMQRTDRCMRWTIAPSTVHVTPLSLTRKITSLLGQHREAGSGFRHVFPLDITDGGFCEHYSSQISHFHSSSTVADTEVAAIHRVLQNGVQKAIEKDLLSRSAVALLPGLPEVWLDALCIGFPHFIDSVSTPPQAVEEAHRRTLLEVVPSGAWLSSLAREEEEAEAVAVSAPRVWYVVRYPNGLPPSLQGTPHSDSFHPYLLPSHWLVQRCALAIGYDSIPPSAREGVASTVRSISDTLRKGVEGFLSSEEYRGKMEEEELCFEVEELPWRRAPVREIGLVIGSSLLLLASSS